MLPLIQNFFKALESEGVLYCHWKSNAFVDRAAQGEDDLDLLISPASQPVFLEILHRFGFKEVLTPKGKSQIPGILSYYGYDETAGRMIHAHVHYKLILGHDMTKNYHLPIENRYLRSSFKGDVLRIPAPEFEFAVFVVRMTLKYSTWNAILSGQGKLSGRERQEIEYLQKRAAREQIVQVLKEHLPFLKLELFDQCLLALQPGCRFWVRFRAGRELHRVLHGCGLRPKVIDTWLQFWRRLATAGKQRLFGKTPRNKLKNGGLLVAFVGGDGAGKTTMIDGILEWLSPCFATMKCHMGKPSWSWTTVLIRGILKAGRVLRLWPFARVPYDFCDEHNPSSFPGYPSLIREVCTARDRYRSYVRARRQADKGVLVICDRFPLPQMVSVDGPQVERMTRTLPSNRFIRFLSQLEGRYYQPILPPDLLFVLKVDPNTTVERKSDENAAYVRARSKEIWDKDWAGSGAHIVDAAPAKTEVLQRIKSLLWAHL